MGLSKIVPLFNLSSTLPYLQPNFQHFTLCLMNTNVFFPPFFHLFLYLYFLNYLKTWRYLIWRGSCYSVFFFTSSNKEAIMSFCFILLDKNKILFFWLILTFFENGIPSIRLFMTELWQKNVFFSVPDILNYDHRFWF